MNRTVFTAIPDGRLSRRSAVGRLTGDPPNQAIGIAAIVVAVIVLIVPLAVAGLRLLRPEHD